MDYLLNFAGIVARLVWLDWLLILQLAEGISCPEVARSDDYACSILTAPGVKKIAGK